MPLLLNELARSKEAWQENGSFDRETLIAILYKLGFIAGYDSLAAALAHTTDMDLTNAVVHYQYWHGLTISGKADAEFIQSLLVPRICSHPDVQNLGFTLPKWNKHELTYYVDDAARFSSLSKADFLAAIQFGWDQWTLVANIRGTYSTNEKTADVVISTGTIDGPWGVLAYSELPDGSDMQRHQKFDEQESWAYSDQPTRFQVDLGRVYGHELGHCLGLSHLPSGNLMQPMYSPNIRAPQSGDTQEMLARYGPPVTIAPPPAPPVPVPPPVVPPVSPVLVTLELSGPVLAATIPGFTIRKN